MNLAAWLIVLANGEGSSAAEKNRAASRVNDEIASWIGGFLRAKGFALSEDDREDLLQHLLLRASTGSARFRGTTDGEAYAWCRRVLYNKAVDLVTITNREGRDERAVESAEPAASEGEVGVASKQIEVMIARIEAAILRTSRKNDAPGLLSSFRCHVDARLGASIEAQIDRYGFAGPFEGEERTEDALQRARNRVYQWRKRGREAGEKALRSLRAAGLDDEAALALMARFLGCKERPRGAKAAKGALS